MKVNTVFNNFSRGQMDSNLKGRFDLPVFASGAERFVNFISNFQGNALYRPGTEYLFDLFDCNIVEFKFNFQQSYLVLFYNTKIRFMTFDSSGNFGYVLNGGSPLEVATPYSLAESKEIQVAQNADVMYVVHNNYAPYKLTRTSATTFTFATFSRTADPFTAGSYPACVCFHRGRLFYANTLTKPTTVYGSKVGEYDNFTAGTDDDDAVTLSLAEITEKIRWLFPAVNSLVAGSSEGLCTIHGADVGDPITPTDVESPKVNSEGCNDTIPLMKDGTVFYLSHTGRRLYSFNYSLLTESFISDDANIISYDITAGGIDQLKRIKTKHDLIFSVRADGKLVSTNINLAEKVVSWHIHETDGLIKRIATITDNEGYPKLFLLVLRDGDYRLEMLSSYQSFPIRSDFYTGDDPDDIETDDVAYAYKVADTLQDCNFLDCMMPYDDLQSNSITYDPVAGTITATSSVFSSGDVGKYIFYKTVTGYEHGKFEITGYTSDKVVDVTPLNGEPTTNTYVDWYLSFSEVSGLTIFEGRTVSVVANGGYLGDYLVDKGTIILGTEVHTVKIGLTYVGEIKTFDLGFYTQGLNTQVNAKSVYEVVLRLINSSGGLIGTSKYNMSSVQLCDVDGLWGLPALPIDGDEHRTLADDIKRNKVLFIQQKEPLHFEICGVFVNAKYEAGI